jgi:NifB/MoaA-like Fe-S oxidoreductase
MCGNFKPTKLREVVVVPGRNSVWTSETTWCCYPEEHHPHVLCACSVSQVGGTLLSKTRFHTKFVNFTMLREVSNFYQPSILKD